MSKREQEMVATSSQESTSQDNTSAMREVHGEARKSIQSSGPVIIRQVHSEVTGGAMTACSQGSE